MFPFANPRSRSAGSAAVLRPQDVFATLLQPANQMQAAINALPFSPDLLLDKDRVAAGNWSWRDAGRGLTTNTLASNTTAADATWPGYSGANNRVVYGLAQKPKFYVRVSYPGDGTSGRQIAHGLGIAPGMTIVKRRDATSDWPVFHTSIHTFPNPSPVLYLNQAAASASNSLFPAAPTSTTFTVSSNANVNTAGAQYVAYLFAHDPDTTNGIIQCGSFAEGNGTVSVFLGWQPQFLLVRSSNTTSNWFILDTARGWGAGSDSYIYANTSSPEANSFDLGAPNSTGFTFEPLNGTGTTDIYLAIRAPI